MKHLRLITLAVLGLFVTTAFAMAPHDSLAWKCGTIAPTTVSTPVKPAEDFAPVFDFKVTLSGHRYALLEKGFGPWPTKWQRVNYDYGLVAGTDADTKAVVGGAGAWLVWNDDKSPLAAKLGVFGIAQSGSRIDFSLGFSLGTRF